MLAVLAVGVWAARRGKQTKRDYFLSGDKLPWWMIGGSIVASNISSHHLVGVMGTAYHRGFVSMMIEWGAILIGFNALLWVFLPFYLRNGFYTMPEFLQKRFGTAPRGACLCRAGAADLRLRRDQRRAYLGGAALATATRLTRGIDHRRHHAVVRAGRGHGGVYDCRRAAGRHLDRDAATRRAAGAAAWPWPWPRSTRPAAGRP